MPSKNVVKQFAADTAYHIYNRGVNKADIFYDKQDYAVFLSFLKYALLSDEEHKENEVVEAQLLSDAQRFNLRRERLAQKIDLISYCLMPNHFHLLVYQYDPDAITKLMRSVATGYALYFNKRHRRIGSLYQGVYKASRINSDSYWLHVSRYIHLNPLDIGRNFRTYDYSSYTVYTGKKKQKWVKTKRILDDISRQKYAQFVEDWVPYRNDLEQIKGVLANSRELDVQG